jgi:hypothetical protein
LVAVRRGRFSELLELPNILIGWDLRWLPRQRPFGRWIVEVPRDYMNMEVRHDIPEQQVIDMTRLEDAFDGPTHILNVREVLGDFFRRKITEGRHMSVAKHDCYMTVRYCVPFQKRLADSAAVERPAAQIDTKRTTDSAFARFPVLRPGSFH